MIDIGTYTILNILNLNDRTQQPTRILRLLGQRGFTALSNLTELFDCIAEVNATDDDTEYEEDDCDVDAYQEEDMPGADMANRDEEDGGYIPQEFQRDRVVRTAIFHSGCCQYQSADGGYSFIRQCTWYNNPPRCSNHGSQSRRPRGPAHLRIPYGGRHVAHHREFGFSTAAAPDRSPCCSTLLNRIVEKRNSQHLHWRYDGSRKKNHLQFFIQQQFQPDELL